MNIAMWSGPRNLSSAMMYAFDQRADCAVIDEPFYGPYLRMTGLAHPMADEIMASRPEDAETVQGQLRGPSPGGKAHFYQKHMCQHMIPGMPRDFMADCVNVFLIRHPARVASSFLKGYPETVATDLGYDLQAELFDEVKAMGQEPVVIDSADIRADPEGMLRALCEAIGIPFDPAMLSWPSGPKGCDGVWAPHWYKSLHASTGFAGAEGALPEVRGHVAELVEETMPYYERLASRTLARV